MPVENVLIEFIADYSSLDSALDTLEKSGAIDAKVAQAFKQTTAEVNKQAQAIKNTGAAYKGPIQSVDQLDKRTRSFVKSAIEGFELGVRDALEEAGVSAKEFGEALQNANKKSTDSTKSIRQELRELTEQIARAKAAGGPIDQEMIDRAGQLRDAVADANAEISNAGSDTRGIDNVVGSISALAGAFSAVQGAIGLFAEDNEKLQKVLLKVNSAMALAIGIQEVSKAVQKEGALTKLADAAATSTQIAVQKIYTAVTGQATAATIGFKVALAATGIGLFIVAVIALNEALKGTKSDLDAATESIDAQNAAIERTNQLIDRQTSLQIARAELAGAMESELTRIRGRALQAQVTAIEKANNLLIQQRDQLKSTSEAWFALNNQIDKNNETIRGINNDILVTSLNLEKQLADERKQADEDRKQRAEKFAQAEAQRLAKLREQRLAEFADFKAGIELQLLAAEEGSQRQLELRKRLANAELQIALENEKLTAKQRKLLIQQYFKDRIDLEKKFNSERETLVLQNIGSDLNAELQQLNISNARKLELTESALTIQAAIEREAAQGNASKIAEINARRDRAIAEARLQSIRETFEAEQRIANATGGSGQRALERVAADEKQKADVRINAINQLERKEIESIQKRIALNQRLFDAGLISQQEYNVTAAELKDQEALAHENAEKRKTDITLSENEKRRADNIRIAQETVAIFTEVVGVISEIYNSQSERENQKLEQQKAQLAELQEAGAITEKEAITRQKRIEAEEKRIRQQQAQREKTIAVFNALLAIPSAVLKGLQTGGPVLAAIYGALAAAQAAIVIARPVPKFATGKKGNYQGPGQVGEAGSELIQRADGSLYVTTKPTMVYLGKKDKVFTAGETRAMLPTVDRSIMRADKKDSIDYDKLADAILKGYKPAPGTNINIDKEFISESVASGLSKYNYFDRYYSSK